MVETASGAQSLIFAKVFDGDIGELGGGIFDKIPENGLVVVPDEVYFADRGDFGDGGQAVPNNGVARNGKEGLRNLQVLVSPRCHAPRRNRKVA